MNNEQLSEKIYTELRQYYGAITEISRRMQEKRGSGFSRNWIRKVLKGEYEDLELVEVAVDLLKEYRSKEVIHRKRIATTFQEVQSLSLAVA